MQGKVKWFSDAKGYGFITCDDGREVFVHQTKIGGVGHRTLKQGEPVEIEIEETKKGPSAKTVVRLDPP